jgi:hypothetical protein
MEDIISAVPGDRRDHHARVAKCSGMYPGKIRSVQQRSLSQNIFSTLNYIFLRDNKRLSEPPTNLPLIKRM